MRHIPVNRKENGSRSLQDEFLGTTGTIGTLNTGIGKRSLKESPLPAGYVTVLRLKNPYVLLPKKVEIPEFVKVPDYQVDMYLPG
jgi:hypothetical protein